MWQFLVVGIVYKSTNLKQNKKSIKKAQIIFVISTTYNSKIETNCSVLKFLRYVIYPEREVEEDIQTNAIQPEQINPLWTR